MTIHLNRRRWLQLVAGAAATRCTRAPADEPARRHAPLRITGLRITPVAPPDPPLLAYGGCHGPYFLRNIVHLETDGGIVGIGETKGGEQVRAALERTRDAVVGQNAFA